jgi:adenylate cyclase
VTESRKLAAIMFTDMVGYSALAQRNEALALDLLAEHQCQLRPIFLQHGGREIKSIGDGFLVEFTSALQAVRCAIAIQTALVERNASAASERRIQLRIGLHLGDVEMRDGDVFGDGVNIAARVEPLADAGGICITGPVFDQIRNKIDEPLVRLGQPDLKNIQVPIDVYHVVLPWTQGGHRSTRGAGSRGGDSARASA